jgi:hypothetical protein
MGGKHRRLAAKRRALEKQLTARLNGCVDLFLPVEGYPRMPVNRSQ